MENVLTLIVNPAQPSLDASYAGRVRRALDALGADSGPPEWLAEGIACDIAFEGLHPEQADAAARNALPDVPVDVVCGPAAGRRKKLLIADMDSTIVTSETLDDLAAIAGIADRIAPITARAMNGEIDFADALRERVGLLAGLDTATLEQAFAAIAYTAGARTLVQTMRAAGAYTALVSGGFRFFTSRVGKTVGFHIDRSNDLEIDGDHLTGRVVEPVLDKDAKLATLIRLSAERTIALSDTITVGDGANDLPMLLAAGLGVAFRAKPAVNAEARVRIAHSDLTALLYMQGYRREEFAG